MTRSTTTDYGATGTDIIQQALYEIGAYGPYNTIPAEETADVLKVLNYMIKLWQGAPDIDTKGLKMWQRQEASLTLKAQIYLDLMKSGGDVDMDPPVIIKTAMLKTTDGDESPVVPMLMEEYQAIPNKTETGTPTRYYYERQYDRGRLFFNIIPDDTTDVLDIVFLRPLYDLDSAAHDVDFPQHWFLALYLNLAVLLAPRYGKQLADKLTVANAGFALDKAQNFYPENVNVHFEPGRDD